MLNGWLTLDGHQRPGFGEDTFECGIPAKQGAPERRRICVARVQRRHAARSEQKSGAGDTVVETKRIHPPFVDQMVHGGPAVGIRSVRQAGFDVAHQLHSVEVAPDEGRSCLSAFEPGWNGKLPCEKAAGTGRIDEKGRAQRERDTLAVSAQEYTVRIDLRARHLDPIPIIHAQRDGLTDEMVVDVGTYPMRVGKRVDRACGDEEPLRVESAIREGFSWMMPIEGEASFQPSTNVWKAIEPTSMRCQLIAVVQPIPNAQPLQ